MSRRFLVRDAVLVGRLLRLRFDTFSPADLARGMNVELEHGTRDPRTDVTGDDPILTAKIALAHLYERGDYYACARDREAAWEARRRAARGRR